MKSLADERMDHADDNTTNTSHVRTTYMDDKHQIG